MESLFENVDCVSFYVDDLNKGIEFYSDALGLKLLWKTKNSCGLGMKNDITEVVLVNEHNPIVDFKVKDVDKALEIFLNAGGKVDYGPFDIDIGKCVVVEDKWENKFCMLDMSKGKYKVDDNNEVVGLE